MGDVRHLIRAHVTTDGKGTYAKDVLMLSQSVINVEFNNLLLFLAICNPSCVHGTCSAPDTCVCDRMWEGTLCEDGESFSMHHVYIKGSTIKSCLHQSCSYL